MAAHEQQHERVVGIDLRLAVERRRDDDRRVVGDHCLAVAARDLAADVIGHAPQRDVEQPAARIVGHAVARPLLAAAISASCTASSRRREVAKAPDHRAEHLRREVAQQVLDAAVGDVGHALAHRGGPLMTSRTSIAMFSGLPPMPGAADASAAISYARCALDVDDPVAREELLRLRGTRRR